MSLSLATLQFIGAYAPAPSRPAPVAAKAAVQSPRPPQGPTVDWLGQQRRAAALVAAPQFDFLGRPVPQLIPA